MKTGISYYKKVFAEIGSGEHPPLYMLKGEETFIMEEMAEKLASAVIGEEAKSFNLDVEYGSEIDMERFLAAASSFPFLGDRRMLVLREAEKLKGKWKQLLEYCAKPSPSTVMVFLVDTHDETGRKIHQPKDMPALEKLVRANGRIIEFQRLNKADLIKWITQKASKSGIKLDQEAANLLVGSVGDDLYSIQNEIDKLALVYEGSEVSRDELAGVIGNYRMNAVFDLVDRAGSGDEGAALAVLASIITTGAERPPTVVYLLIRHFLALLKIKTGMKAGGYMHNEYKRKADRFSTKGIMVWLENLRVAEKIMKSTSFPERLLLESVFIHSTTGRIMDDFSDSAGAA